MKICILGSTGFLGRVVLRKALEDGHVVRTLVRTPGKLVADEKNLASLQVWVEDLADFVLEQLTSERWIRRAPYVAAARS